MYVVFLEKLSHLHTAHLPIPHPLLHMGIHFLGHSPLLHTLHEDMPVQERALALCPHHFCTPFAFAHLLSTWTHISFSSSTHLFSRSIPLHFCTFFRHFEGEAGTILPSWDRQADDDFCLSPGTVPPHYSLKPMEWID